MDDKSIARCLMASREGDVLCYIGGRVYQHKVIGKHYLNVSDGFPAGYYPIVTEAGVRRVIHPQFYSVFKIIRHR